MKTFNEFLIDEEILNINEALLSKLISWFKNIFKTQEKLIKDNKQVSIKVDTKKIKGPKKPSNIEELTKNKSEMEVINDKIIGFPIMSSILRQQNKYFKDPESKNNFEPKVDRYFYKDEKDVYYIGLAVFDESISKIENYVNIINIEVINNVENKSEIQKFIIDSLNNEFKKKNKTGMLYNIVNPKVKGILTSIGFVTSKENKNWLVKQIK